jgi:hypothetical protein
VLVGLKTRWAAVALFGFCLLTALFFHTASDQVIELQKNIAMAGGFLMLAIRGPGAGRWTPGAPAPGRDDRQSEPRQPITPAGQLISVAPQGYDAVKQARAT